MLPVALPAVSVDPLAVEGSLKPHYRHLGIAGGIEYEPMTYNKETLRAELIELSNQISFQHAPKIVDKILARYDVKRKSFKEKKQ